MKIGPTIKNNNISTTPTSEKYPIDHTFFNLLDNFEKNNIGLFIIKI